MYKSAGCGAQSHTIIVIFMAIIIYTFVYLNGIIVPMLIYSS